MLGVPKHYAAVLVSGSPHYTEGKFLTVSSLVDKDGKPTKTGEAQAKEVFEQVKKWGLEKCIRALVLDTTAYNTGLKKGATKRLMILMEKPLFFLACRHHVSEVIVKDAWYQLFDTDLSPECKFFVNIRDSWGSFTTDATAEITIPDNANVNENVLDFYRKLLMRKDKRNEMTIRDDYRDLANQIYLNFTNLRSLFYQLFQKKLSCLT